MEGTWPVRINGVECGTVSARREGAYTLFTAEAVCNGVVRISLYGGGREGYLGVLAPDANGCMTLTRRMTRSALASFPATPEYAAESGQTPPERRDESDESDTDAASTAEPEGSCENEAQAEAQVKERVEAQTETKMDAEAEPEPAPPAPDTLWYAAPDGTLSHFDGVKHWLAMPSDGVRVPSWAKGVVRRINGREYVVFPR